MKRFIKGLPMVGGFITNMYWDLRRPRRAPELFQGTRKYWQDRYAGGGDSGVGSYGKFAEFKAGIINGFVRDNDIRSIIEFGCGDGNQLQSALYEAYLGLDVSIHAITSCRKKFEFDRSKSFLLIDDYAGETAPLGLSLDVIYHLVEDDVFDKYMRLLFDASTEYVIIYSSNTDN